MADVKISQLPSATLPLTGAELVPLVQGGVTKNVPTTSLLSAPIAGNLNFTGTGNRITGDFSNATLANRVAFMDATTNNQTALAVIPNGTSTVSSFVAFGGSDPNNCARGSLRVAGTSDVQLRSDIAGTGTYIPLTFYTGGSERVRIDTSGNVGIGTSSPVAKLHSVTSGASNGTVDSRTGLHIQANNISTGTANARIQFSYASNTPKTYIEAGVYGADYLAFGNGAGNAEAMRIDGSGNVLVTGGGGLGYGTGSGGTVTQATSRTTAVTLNKPTGQITMFTAAGSSTPALFAVNNSTVAASDVIVINLKSGASNNYVFQILGVSAGQFVVQFHSQAGTASDTPVLSFAVIKGATA